MTQKHRKLSREMTLASAPGHVLALDDERATLMSLTLVKPDTIEVASWHLGEESPGRTTRINNLEPLGRVLADHAPWATTIVEAPAWRVVRPKWRVLFRFLYVAIAFAILFTILDGWDTSGLIGTDFLVMRTFFAALFAWPLIFIPPPPMGSRLILLEPGPEPLTFESLVSDVRRELAGLPRPTPARDRAAARVETLRQRYAEMAADIVARIDLPALFSQGEPATSEFLESLVRFETMRQHASDSELAEAASDAEIAFGVALSNAQRLGIDFLPERSRDEARRASKVARLTKEGTTEGERLAAWAQVRRIIDDIPEIDLPRQIEN